MLELGSLLTCALDRYEDSEVDDGEEGEEEEDEEDVEEEGEEEVEEKEGMLYSYRCLRLSAPS